jgi:tRNA-dihydrouridine synthase
MANFFNAIGIKSERVRACAPMVDQSDACFRVLVRTRGSVDMCVTPMRWANKFVDDEHYRLQTLSDCQASAKYGPLGVQFAGNDPSTMAKAAQMIASSELVQFVDVNFGCPQRVAKRENIGAWLVHNDSDLCVRIVQAMSNALRESSVALSVKIRIWPTREHERMLRFVVALHDAGAPMIVVHGRTLKQNRDGESDWRRIRDIVDVLRPRGCAVLANGSVRSVGDERRCLQVTNAHGVMVAEPLLVDPYLFVRNQHEEEADNDEQRSAKRQRLSDGSASSSESSSLSSSESFKMPTGLPRRFRQVPMAIDYMALVDDTKPSAKSIREHLLHMLFYRRRSFSVVRSIGGDDLCREFLFLNSRCKPLRQRLFKAQSVDELRAIVSELDASVTKALHEQNE